MKKFILSLILVLAIAETKAQEILPDNWTQYCGWHYGGQIPKWGGWVREYAKDKFGRFIIDSAANQIDTTKLNDAYKSLLTLDTSIDILQLDGGLGSARDTAGVVEWMEMIEADNGKFWKSIVYQQTLKLTELPNSQKRVYWQIGNEISSPAYSRTIRYWKDGSNINGYNYDKFVIPYYIENYLAPTVEAIDSASKAVYNEKGKINICLGSITNAHNTNAQQFLDSLLNYRIVGINAPSLAGKYVYELIHIITIHYAMGTANTSDWLNNINWYKSWTGKGRIRGVWSTEEVGINQATAGNGAFVGSIVTSRYLEWAINNQYSSKEVRTNYYGWNTGNSIATVNAFNTFLYNHLGNTKLSNVNPLSTNINFSGTIEKHSFKTELGNKGVLLVFPERIQGQNTMATINSITLNHSDWGNITNISVYKYNSTGINIISSTTNQIGNTTVLSFSSIISLNNTDGLLVLIEAQPILSVNDNILNPLEYFLYLNPATESFTIKSLHNQNFNEKIRILNILGSLVEEIDFPQNGQINVSELSNGVYFVHFKNHPQQTFKFIKQ